MKRKFLELIVGVAVISVVALQPGFAQGTDAGHGKDEATKEQPAAASEKTHPGQEGIKVHGRWAIEIRNPDGMLVSHREFENALASNGPTLLSQILARTVGIGLWGISLDGSPGPCNNASSQPALCMVTEGPSQSASGTFFTLSISSTSAGTMVLTGSATAANTSTINNVRTANSICTAAYQSCSLGGFYWLTSATVSPAINVAAGQTIAATVTIRQFLADFIQPRQPVESRLRVHQFLRPRVVLQPGKTVLHSTILQSLPVHLPRQPLSPVEADLDRKRKPCLDAGIVETKFPLNSVLVDELALPRLPAQFQTTGMGIEFGAKCPAWFHAG